jgi:O-antigen biosynthesis protein
VIEPNWLREMVSHAVRPSVGAVGAKLLYPDGTVQHAGITLGMLGLAGHQYQNKASCDPGYFGQLMLARNVTATTGACLMVRRDVFLQVGGLDEASLPVAFNDVDFCLKLVESGYLNVWTPYAELYHLESASRGGELTRGNASRFGREVACMRARWGRKLERDPYWNHNLSLNFVDVYLATPAEAEKSGQGP